MSTPTFHQLLVSRELGGAGLIGLHLADHLRHNGRAVRVWVPGPGPAEREAAHRDLPTQLYDPAPARSQWKLRAAWGNWAFGERLRRGGPGLVHVHSPHSYGALRWGLRRSGLKSVVHVHLEEGAEGLRWAFRRPPELIVTCARFLVDHVRPTLPAHFRQRQRIVAVPNAVDAAKFSPGDKGSAKRAVGAPAGVPLLLMLANLAPHKGQETAIHAVARLKRRGVGVACWLAGVERGGGNGYTARLESLIAELEVGDRVRLLGQRNDAPELLRAADLFLLPSTNEGLPLSVLEAQSAKVPVLAAPTAGVPEVVHDGETGFLIAAADAAGYADRIERVLNDHDLYGRVAEAAHRRVVQEHNWQTYCRRVEELYRELLSDTPSRTGSWPKAACMVVP